MSPRPDAHDDPSTYGPPYPFWTRRGAPDPRMRVGNAERNRVAEALSHHYSEGRLDDAELQQRLDQAMGAKTHGDLAGLLSDLPPFTGEEPPAPPHRRIGVGFRPVVFVFILVALLSVRHLWWFPTMWWWFPGPFWLLAGLGLLLLWRRSRHRPHRWR